MPSWYPECPPVSWWQASPRKAHWWAPLFSDCIPWQRFELQVLMCTQWRSSFHVSFQDKNYKKWAPGLYSLKQQRNVPTWLCVGVGAAMWAGMESHTRWALEYYFGEGMLSKGLEAIGTMDGSFQESQKCKSKSSRHCSGGERLTSRNAQH